MTTLDRERQFNILQGLAASYPRAAVVPSEEQSEPFIANRHYLMEHGLVGAEFYVDQSRRPPDPSRRGLEPRYLARNIRSRLAAWTSWQPTAD